MLRRFSQRTRVVAALLACGLGAALVLGSVLGVTRLRDASAACRERPIPGEAIMFGAGEGLQIDGAYSWVPFGVTCTYTDTRNPDTALTVADGPLPAVALTGGLLLMLGSPLLAARRR